MPYEEDYKMWLEKMLIKMNPDWICDGMHDTEFTREWCEKYCGKDDLYITPKCLHMYYHHIARADCKTENSSEKPNNCEGECDTCRYSYITCRFMDKGEPCNYEPKDEPQLYEIGYHDGFHQAMADEEARVLKSAGIYPKDEPQTMTITENDARIVDRWERKMAERSRR